MTKGTKNDFKRNKMNIQGQKGQKRTKHVLALGGGAT